jgi:hypothetical protein
MRRARPALLAAAVALAVGATCQTELPSPPAGRRVSGLIRYQGAFHHTLVRPALQIALLTSVPDPNRPQRPHGLAVIETRDLEAVFYQLENIPPFRYRLVARVIDLAQPELSEHVLPSGGYPDLCTFLDAAEGNVAVNEETPTSGVNFTLYDSGGTTDPCFTNPVVGGACPKAGAGTLEVVLELARPPSEVRAPDQLIFAMLKEPTEFPPTRFRLLSAQDLVAKGGFPYTLVINDVPPESYIVYACYDVGGNNIAGCGPMDFVSEYMKRAKLAVAAGKITTVRLGLDDGSSELVSVTGPAARGCPPP